MATWRTFRCDHTQLEGMSGHREIADGDLCADCRSARIGEIIPFARHGTPPVSGHSRNHRDQTREEGVSVYEVVEGEIHYTGWWFDIARKPLYLGTGRIVGFGSDGEPLVEILSIAKA